MEAFSPFLYNALGNQEEPGLCSMAIGLVSDITRSMGPLSQPYCDTFMNYLLNNLRVRRSWSRKHDSIFDYPLFWPPDYLKIYLQNIQSTALANQFKPAILQCFGDIAGAIGGHFETYLSVVAQVLQQAAGVQASPDGSYEMFDYVISLREGIMDAWGGIIGAMKTDGKSTYTCILSRDQSLTKRLPAALLQQYVESIFSLLNIVWLDQNRSDALMRASMGVIG
jgi:importin subunit beta-1